MILKITYSKLLYGCEVAIAVAQSSNVDSLLFGQDKCCPRYLC